jgi:hypothetical protein
MVSTGSFVTKDIVDVEVLFEPSVRGFDNGAMGKDKISEPAVGEYQIMRKMVSMIQHLN